MVHETFAVIILTRRHVRSKLTIAGIANTRNNDAPIGYFVVDIAGGNVKIGMGFR